MGIEGAGAGPSTPARKLAQAAAKKGVIEKGNIHRMTRLGAELKPEDPKMAAFNLNNFKKTSTMQQMKFMLQEFNKLAMAQFEKMELSMKQKADLVAFSLKNYQKEGIFANVDSAIFYVQDNLVRLYFAFFLNTSNNGVLFR